MLIAWKCLQLATKQIVRTAVLTKVCNDLLPMAVRMQQYGYFQSPVCSECDRLETFDHMIQCRSKVRGEWRFKTCCELRQIMLRTNTHSVIIQCFMMCLDEWFKNGDVRPPEVGTRLQMAVKSQNRIGWRHFFMGKISQEWLTLYSTMRPRDEGGKQINYIQWGRKVVEHILRLVIKLWESCSAKIHDEDSKVSPKRQEKKIIADMRRMQTFPEEACPEDEFLFIEDCNEFIKKSSFCTMARYVTMTTRAVQTSVKKWKWRYARGISLQGWLRSNPENERFVKQSKKQQRDIRKQNGRQKERRKNRQTQGNKQQTLLSFFLSRYHVVVSLGPYKKGGMLCSGWCILCPLRN